MVLDTLGIYLGHVVRDAKRSEKLQNELVASPGSHRYGAALVS